MKLVLASTSPYRKALLDRLHVEYECDSPEVDESPLESESVENMVARLAQLKAEAVAGKHSDALIIGSDQSAELDGKPLSKPGNFDNAVRQLQNASNKRVVFQTGLCLLNTRTGKSQSAVVPYTVVFRPLTDNMIEYYLKKEEPYNCAGSFKSEGLGIALFKKFEGEDPNALIGLPLIELIKMLENEDFSVLGDGTFQSTDERR
jgi:MAF protein